MNSKSKEVFERIKQCCESACLGLGQSPYNRFLQSITPCREDLEVLQQELDRLEQLEEQLKEGNLSDGYHTFNDLYYQRLILFATIVNQNKQLAWKSLKHEYGELCFGGNWFIVGIDTPRGSYTYHYEINYWSLFDCKELEVAKHWDGHTSKDIDRLLSLKKDTQLEKELKQTKLNFKNSQIHSKNCYKKLKEKYTRLERAYKNNEVMTKDLNELINRNLELKNELKRSQETISAWMENHKKLIIDNGKMKKVIKILGEHFELFYNKYTDTHEIKAKLPLSMIVSKKTYDLLKEVFESVGGK